jgi:hypothetical protein
VNSLLPAALMAMFAKRHSNLATNALRSLAELAPQIVIPAIIDQYVAMNLDKCSTKTDSTMRFCR